MILVFFAVLYGVSLQPMVTASPTAKQYKTDYTKFCTYFKQQLPSFTYDPKSSHSFNAILVVYSKLAGQSLFTNLKVKPPIIENVMKTCTSDTSYTRVECLFAKRYSITHGNSDWDMIFKGQRKEAVMPAYVSLWLLHPVMRGCAKHIQLPTSYDAPKKLLAGLVGNDVGAFANIFRKSPSKTMIRLEIEKLCSKQHPDPIFCTDLLQIIKLTDTYLRVKDEASSSAKWKAYRLHFVMLRESNPGMYHSILTQQEAQNLIDSNVKQIFTYTNTWNTLALRNMVNLLPEKSPHLICNRNFLLYFRPSREKKELCLLWKIVSQIHAFLKSTVPMANGHVKKILNTEIDYPTFLKMTEMNEILSLVRNQGQALTKLTKWVASEVKKDTSTRFHGLQTYFKQVESFSRRKSKADVDFIKGRLGEYKSEATTLTDDLSETVGILIKYSFKVVGAQIAEQTIQLGLAMAVVANPLEKLFGGSSLGDVLDRTAALANSIAALNELDQASRAFAEVKNSMTSIFLKIDKNDDFLGNLKTLIDDIDKDRKSAPFEKSRQDFLKDYTDYNPQLKRPELTALTAKYENLINAVCDVIANTDATGSGVIKAIVNERGYCPNAKETAAKLFETYAEIYDFQFELVEAMAAYMRATNAYEAASYINADFEKLNKVQNRNVLEELQTLTFFSFVSYKVNIWGIAEAYCDILTYKEGGKAPSVCSTNQRTIPSLAAHTTPACRNIESYKDVPISSNNDQGFLDLPSLYAGKEVTFQIPNSQWLVANKWITQHDQHSSIVIKKLEVFLPTQSTVKRPVRITAKLSGSAKLKPSSKTNYVLIPSKVLIADYHEGAGSEDSCRKISQVLNNPYGGSLPKICTLNVDENNCQELLQKSRLSASVYSRWKITVSGYETTPAPKPVNDDFRIKVGVKLCILAPNRSDRGEKKSNKPIKSKKSLKDEGRKSCPKQKYWSIKSQRCIDCPKGSTPELDGYFCVKNSNEK